MRKIVRGMGISDPPVRRMAKTELGLNPYKFRNVQLLTDKNKLVQLQRCRKLLRRAASQRLNKARGYTFSYIRPLWILNAPSPANVHCPQNMGRQLSATRSSGRNLRNKNIRCSYC
ncbi:hypothetical protein AVEN_52783-1 [Araneus ventricosus]|uniref:Transposase Tc1-like domain-containing protein n=1 Tax=Araneus ventricosus TaxID=182803 RepID=A0A4Y2CW88_ARAVE|nr:hypothetical protein AVEN_52783-1 [Araneus ventricosus]